MLRKNRVLIDLGALRSNYQLIRDSIPANVRVMCVIKADAYGHGMLQAAQALASEGATHFAVAIPEEGVYLRENGVQGEILVLGAVTPGAATEAIRHSLSQTVFTPQMIHLLEEEAVRLGMDAYVHVKLETGMNRIGLQTAEEAQLVAQALKECTHVHPVGIYTHMAAADEPEADGTPNAFSYGQLKRFGELRSHFDSSIPTHVANSALTLLGPHADHDMVRAGIVLYGYPPVETPLPFRSVMSWYTEVVHVKTVHAGESIGYGCTFTATADMRVATVAVGYGDGYHRACSNRGQMLIRGKRAPILGRVCMDQTMVDVTDIPDAAAGDEVVLLGQQGNEMIDAGELAGWAGTISYEVLLAIAPRVARLYTGG